MFKLSLALLIASVSWATTATINTPGIGRASTPLVLTGSGTGTGALTYFWQQTAGPCIGVWSNRTTVNPSFTACLAGNYTIQLTVIDSIGTPAVTTATLGAIATDNNFVTVVPDFSMNRLLGPLLRLGNSYSPYYDIADRALANTIATAALANPPSLGTAYTGTVQVLNTPGRLVGTGTLFTTEFSVGDDFIIAWNTIDGTGTGRAVQRVTAIIDNTHMDIYYQQYMSLGSGYVMYRIPATTSTFQPSWWGIGIGAGTNAGWNYYDVSLALYRLYYRTGITSYLTQARQIADYWWQWGIDHGRMCGPPRVTSLHSQFIRALDGHTERLPELQTMVNYWVGSTVCGTNALPTSTTNRGTTFDAREAGYAMWYQAIGAMADTDATRHAAYCTNLISTIVPPWIAHQHPDGFWSEDLFFQNNYFYLVPGSSPWRTDIAIHGLQTAYDILIDTASTGCNDPTLAASLLTAITDAVGWTYNYGRSNPSSGGNGGVYYDVNYETDGQNGTTGLGTISTTLSSVTVTGIGSTFLASFGSTGTKYIFFNNSRTGYKVTNSVSDTVLTISPAFGTQGESAGITNGVYFIASQASTSCASSAPFCFDLGYWGAMPNGDRNLVRFMPSMTSWLFYRTGNTTYKTWADNWFINAFGGPGNGPGGSDPCVGSGCDGIETDMVAALPACAISPNPPTICNSASNYPGGNVFQYTGKNYGQTSGAPGAQLHLGYRLGGVLPADTRTLYISTLLSDTPTATKMRVTITLADGTVTTTTCTGSPCAVTADARQAGALLKVDHLSNTNVVLSTGIAQPLQVN